MKLRENGIYRFKDREYIAVILESAGESWGVTGLVYWPVGSQMPRDIIYLRHATGEVIDVGDFQTVGTLMDLEDTGRDDARQSVLVEEVRGRDLCGATINVKKRRFEPCGKPATHVYKTHPEGAGVPNCREHAEVALEILEKGDTGSVVLTWDDADG